MFFLLSLPPPNLSFVSSHRSDPLQYFLSRCCKSSYRRHEYKEILEKFSKPNIRVGSGRTGSKIVSKFRLTHNRKLRSANRNTIDHAAALVSSCRKSRSLCPKEVFLVKLCKSGGLLLPSPPSLVIPWPTSLAHSFTDDDHVPAENLLPK